VLHGAGAHGTDQHVVVTKPPRALAWPEPTLRTKRSGLPRPTIQLSERELLNHSGDRAGWIDRPGQPLLYWSRRDRESVVLVLFLERDEIAEAIDEWFRLWLANGASGTFAGVMAAGGPHRVDGASGRIIGASGPDPVDPERPDFLLPVRARYGTWQLAAWDQYQLRTNYHLPTVASAVLLGLFTALLGSGVFVQQRRAAALAAQRVSFVNRVSHELRTPLTNILLNIDIAHDTLIDTAGETTRRLALVQEEARRLGRLIENVLTFSRHEQGKLRIEPCACVPASVIDAVVDQFAPSFARRALQVRRAGDVTFPCLIDSDALAQILSNLLSNVEKYVPGGTVEITSEHRGDSLSMTISDQGPGIPATETDRIFRPFERLDSRVNEGASGTGLGLAIARDLAISMGGSLRLVPAGSGASFQVIVPAPSVGAPALLPAAPTQASA
jgi:signal transduction histidine kinase